MTTLKKDFPILMSNAMRQKESDNFSASICLKCAVGQVTHHVIDDVENRFQIVRRLKYFLE